MAEYTIKARPTEYNGVLYRSRLEALWAQAFNDSGDTFKYEPETVLMDNGAIYTPDFLVDYGGVEIEYYEIKPTFFHLSASDWNRIISFIQHKKKLGVCFKFLIYCGPPTNFGAFGIDVSPEKLFIIDLLHDSMLKYSFSNANLQQ